MIAARDARHMILRDVLHRWPAVAAGAAHGVRMAAGLVVIKLISVITGPAGLGALGNLMSVVTMITVFAGGGIMNGVTKYVAEYRRAPERLDGFLRSAVAFSAIFSLLLLLVTTAAAAPIANWLFTDAGLAWAVPLIGVAQAFGAIGAFVVAVANGQYRSDLFAFVTISAHLLAIPCAAALIALGGFPGAVLAVLSIPAWTAVPALWLIARGTLRLSIHRPALDRGDARRLLTFGAMTLVSAASFPLAEIAIRSSLIAREGVAEAGLWQALIRLSGAIMGFVTVYLGTSYMPRLSACPERRRLVAMVLRQLLIVAISFAALALVLYLLRAQLIALLFSQDFMPLADVIHWQLLGDTARVCAYVIGFLAIAKASLRFHVIAEICQFGLWAGISLLVIERSGGTRELAQAYAVTYAIYLAAALLALALFSRRPSSQ